MDGLMNDNTLFHLMNDNTLFHFSIRTTFLE